MARDSGNIILWNVMLESKLQHTVGLSKEMVPSLEDGNLLTDKNQQLQIKERLNMDPKQQARSHEMLKMFAWCGHKLTTLRVQDFAEP